MNEKSAGFINHFSLKMIAVISMLTDHVGLIFFPEYPVLRCIGRIAFPIYCYLIVEGFHHTRSPFNYFIRLFIFTIISEIPFDLAFRRQLFDWGHQNVFFTLTLGLLCIFCMEEINNRRRYWILLVFLWITAYLIHCDYGLGGVLLICMFYVTEKSPLTRLILCTLILYLFFGLTELYGMLALAFIAFYNKKKGPEAKMFFYWFYPVHLLLLYLIKTYV